MGVCVCGGGLSRLMETFFKATNFPTLGSGRLGALNLFLLKIEPIVDGCCMKMCDNWCKWGKTPPFLHPATLFMSMRWGAPHPPWFLHTGFGPFKRRPLQLWSSIWVRKNIFFLHTVPRKPKFLPPPYANAAGLNHPSQLQDLYSVMAPSSSPWAPSALWPPYLPCGVKVLSVCECSCPAATSAPHKERGTWKHSRGWAP